MYAVVVAAAAAAVIIIVIVLLLGHFVAPRCSVGNIHLFYSNVCIFVCVGVCVCVCEYKIKGKEKK